MSVQATEIFRSWIRDFIREGLNTTQLVVATEAKVQRIWLNQVITGKRAKRVERLSLEKVKDAMLRLSNNGNDPDLLKDQIEMQFEALPGFNGPEVTTIWDIPQCNKYAADLFGVLLEDKVPPEHMKTIIIFLSGMTEAYKTMKK